MTPLHKCSQKFWRMIFIRDTLYHSSFMEDPPPEFYGELDWKKRFDDGFFNEPVEGLDQVVQDMLLDPEMIEQALYWDQVGFQPNQILM